MEHRNHTVDFGLDGPRYVLWQTLGQINYIGMLVQNYKNPKTHPGLRNGFDPLALPGPGMCRTVPGSFPKLDCNAGFLECPNISV